MVVYFNVCGGPWGSEQIVSAAGPLVGLTGLAIFAVFLGIPSIVMTTELTSLFPLNGGYSIWVKEAFGDMAAFQCTWWSWGSGVVDSALYPVMFFEIVRGATNALENITTCEAFLCKLGFLIVFAVPNFLFVDVVGKWLILLCAMTVAPFVVFSVVGIFFTDDGPRPDPSKLLESKSFRDCDLTTLLSLLYWNFSGFDCISTCSGEVKRPGRTVWYGSLLAWCLMVVLYAVPLAVGTCVDDPKWQDFEDGSFNDIAKTIQMRSGWIDASHDTNGWLVLWLTIASGAAFMGQFSAELMEDSFQMLGASRTLKLLPPIFGWKHRTYRTPWACIVFQMVIIASLLTFDFNKIIIIDNSFSILSYLLEVASMLKLRRSSPHLQRPFQNIPVLRSFVGTCVVMMVPVCLASIVFVCQLVNDEWIELVAINASFLALGFAMGAFTNRRRGGTKKVLLEEDTLEISEGTDEDRESGVDEHPIVFMESNATYTELDGGDEESRPRGCV